MTKTLLIVEDNSVIALDMMRYFKSKGLTIIGPAKSVAMALTLLEDNHPDYVILDYHLGEETSVPIAHALTQRSIPYALTTGGMLQKEAAMPVKRSFLSRFRKAKPAPPDPLRPDPLRHVPIFSKPIDYEALLDEILTASAGT